MIALKQKMPSYMHNLSFMYWIRSWLSLCSDFQPEESSCNLRLMVEYFGLMDDSFEWQATVGMYSNLLICLPLTMFFH